MRLAILKGLNGRRTAVPPQSCCLTGKDDGVAQWEVGESDAYVLLDMTFEEAVQEVNEAMATENHRIEKALDVVLSDGGIDGDHHKQWVIDQMVRCLTGDDYEQWVKEFEDGEDGPETYNRDEGIAP